MKLQTIKQNLAELRENTEDLLRGKDNLPPCECENTEVKNLHYLLHMVESDIRSDMVVILKHLELLIDRIKPKGPSEGFDWNRGTLN